MTTIVLGFSSDKNNNDNNYVTNNNDGDPEGGSETVDYSDNTDDDKLDEDEDGDIFLAVAVIRWDSC